MKQFHIEQLGLYFNLKIVVNNLHKVYYIWKEKTCKSECDIRENFDTNECPNIFVSTKLHE